MESSAAHLLKCRMEMEKIIILTLKLISRIPRNVEPGC